MKAPVAVMGLANPLLTDEGVGVRIVEALENRPTPAGVDVLDMGTGGLGILHEIAGRRKVIFVDCAFMGESPGTLRRFTPEEAVSRKVQPRLSLHEGDLFQTLDLARNLGECPEEVVLFGIEPASVAPGDRLSEVLVARLDHYVDCILRECSDAFKAGTGTAP